MPEIQLIEIKRLTLLESNPRQIDKAQFKKLCKSIDEDPDFFGQRPCLVNDDGEKLIVYAGNQRLQAAKSMGWKMAPCIISSNLDPQVLKNRILKDNAHYGEFDWDILSSEYEISDMLDAGLTAADLHLDLEEPPTKPKKKKMVKCPNCDHEF